MVQYLNRNIPVLYCIFVVMINNYIVYYNVCCVSLTLFCVALIFTEARKMNVIKIKYDLGTVFLIYVATFGMMPSVLMTCTLQYLSVL